MPVTGSPVSPPPPAGSLVAVDIYVKDESVVPTAIAGVEVGIFNPSTHTLVASSATDVNGLAAFSLPGSASPGTSYEVRFFKLGVNFHGLQTIQVLNPATSVNKFDHTGADSNILPLSGSPTLCRCTGVFTDFRGQPMADKSIRIIARGNTIDRTPKLWNSPSKMVGTDFLEVRTDANGRISVDLIRKSTLLVSWGGDEDSVWTITVPDRDSANLIDLIHPFPALWDWDDTIAPGDVVSVAVGANVEVPLTVTLTDYSQSAIGLEQYFELMNSDGSLVEATYVSGRGVLVLRGLVAGIVTITPTLKPNISPNRWPIPTVVAPVLTVTITP